MFCFGLKTEDVAAVGGGCPDRVADENTEGCADSANEAGDVFSEPANHQRYGDQAKDKDDP